MTRFLSNAFIEQKFGAATASIVRRRQLSSYSAIADKDAPLTVVTPVDGYYYSSTGNKGAMIWKFLQSKFKDDFFSIVRLAAEDGVLTLAELRTAFGSEKAYLDYSLDQVTEMNLMVGTPQPGSGMTKSALRNLGGIDVEVAVVATDSTGKTYTQTVTIPSKGFSEVTFATPAKISNVEIDPDKLYTQIAYNDDIAPRIINENDPLVFIKREFDKQDFETAAANALVVLGRFPQNDEARVFLARSYLSLDRITDAKTAFEAVLKSTLPSPQSVGWSLVGLGDIARKTGQTDDAMRFYKAAIDADAEYGTTLAARRGRSQLAKPGDIPAEVASFFSTFDKAVVSNSKAAVEQMIMKGEISRFAASVTGQAQAWETKIVAADKVDDENVMVETALNLRLLNRDNESGLAVFKLTRVGGSYKLSGVEVFEVN